MTMGCQACKSVRLGHLSGMQGEGQVGTGSAVRHDCPYRTAVSILHAPRSCARENVDHKILNLRFEAYRRNLFSSVLVLGDTRYSFKKGGLEEEC